MAEKKYTEHLGLTQQSEEDFVDGEEISRSFSVLDEEVFSIREKTNNLKNEDHYYSNDYYTFPEKINSITYGEGKYVAAGEYNIYSSVDKRSWNISDSRSGISVAYGNGKYMAVVFYSGYYSLLTSPDGTGWTEIQILVDGVQSTRKLNEIAYEDGKFVIVGDGGKIYTSDGTQITEQSSPTSIDLKSVCFGNGIFLAIGYKTDTSVLLKSSDAITWELISLSPQLARNKYEKIVFGNGIFVLKDRMRCYTTTDGTDLALHSTPEPPSGGDVCFAGNKFFLSCRTKNFISTNGIEWTDITKEFALIFPVIKYFNNEIIGTTAENKLIGINKYTVDGIREDVAKLNSALNNIVTSPVIGEVTNYTTSEKEYINIAWSSYHFLLITWGSYGNVYQTILIPSTYIDSTNSGKRIIVGNDELQIYKKSENSLSARATTASQINRAIIYGIMPK